MGFGCSLPLRIWIELLDQYAFPMHPTSEVYKQSMKPFLLSLKEMKIYYFD